jgi:tetratricopeptide (TPR) repeat protein
MARHALEALRSSGEGDHAVRSRVGLVLAQALHLADRLDLALPWYENARTHASAEGDEAALSALMHNMAWLRAQRLRASDCELVACPTSEERYALLGVESTKNFDLLIGSTSLVALVPMLRAQVLTVRGQYTAALALFETEMTPALQSGMTRLHADLLADQAWCYVKLQQHEPALRLAKAAEANIDHNGQFDDRAIAHGRLAQTFSILGLPGEASQNRELAERAWASHMLLQVEIVRSLAEALPAGLQGSSTVSPDTGSPY